MQSRHNFTDISLKLVIYRRTGFNCETLIIANCEIISSSQILKRKQKFTQSMSRGLVLHLQTVSSFQFSVLRVSHESPTLFQARQQAPHSRQSRTVCERGERGQPGIVTRTLERSEASAGKKRKYTTTFTPEDRAAIARYAAQNGNSAAVKKFKASHNVGESTVFY